MVVLTIISLTAAIILNMREGQRQAARSSDDSLTEDAEQFMSPECGDGKHQEASSTHEYRELVLVLSTTDGQGYQAGG